MVVNALRFFGMSDYAQIEDMYLDEYMTRLEAYQLAELDRQRDMHMQAWINQQAKATRKNGKPYYPNFDAFYGKTYKREQAEIIATMRGKSTAERKDFNRRRELDRLFRKKLAELEGGENKE